MLKFKYYGHSAFALHDGQQTLLFDPFFTGNPQASTKASQVNCDYILISHGHSDHVGDGENIAMRTQGTMIGVPEILAYCHAERQHAMNIGGKAIMPFGEIYMTPAVHSGGVPGSLACGYVVNIAGKNIYYAGDTALFGDMALIAQRYAIDVAILPIGDNFTMGPQDALAAIKLLHPAHVIPVHYNTWPVIAQNPEEFEQLVESHTATKVHIVHPGAELSLEDW